MRRLALSVTLWSPSSTVGAAAGAGRLRVAEGRAPVAHQAGGEAGSYHRMGSGAVVEPCEAAWGLCRLPAPGSMCCRAGALSTVEALFQPAL